MKHIIAITLLAAASAASASSTFEFSQDPNADWSGFPGEVSFNKVSATDECLSVMEDDIIVKSVALEEAVKLKTRMDTFGPQRALERGDHEAFVKWLRQSVEARKSVKDVCGELADDDDLTRQAINNVKPQWTKGHMSAFRYVLRVLNSQ